GPDPAGGAVPAGGVSGAVELVPAPARPGGGPADGPPADPGLWALFPAPAGPGPVFPQVAGVAGRPGAAPLSGPPAGPGVPAGSGGLSRVERRGAGRGGPVLLPAGRIFVLVSLVPGRAGAARVLGRTAVLAERVAGAG